tara:strand:- start:221 stop:607 length:387 start_codon:yes stop_codon:yes gene_type:complete
MHPSHFPHLLFPLYKTNPPTTKTINPNTLISFPLPNTFAAPVNSGPPAVLVALPPKPVDAVAVPPTTTNVVGVTVAIAVAVVVADKVGMSDVALATSDVTLAITDETTEVRDEAVAEREAEISELMLD